MVLRAGAGGDLDCPPCASVSECPAIAQFTTLAGTRTPCGSNTDCGGLGICNLAIGRCVTPSQLDTGWTGLAHDADVNDIVPARLILDCEGPAPCGECGIVGLDPVLRNCRCAGDHRTACFNPFENDSEVCGGAACECYFGPPLPLIASTVPTCVLNRVTSVGGNADVDRGAGTIDFTLRELVHLGAGQFAPCPYCNGDPVPGDGTRQGSCVGGVDDAQSCDAQSGNATFPAPGGGRASLDCFPDPGTNVSGAGARPQRPLLRRPRARQRQRARAVLEQRRLRGRGAGRRCRGLLDRRGASLLLEPHRGPRCAEPRRAAGRGRLLCAADELRVRKPDRRSAGPRPSLPSERPSAVLRQ